MSPIPQETLQKQFKATRIFGLIMVGYVLVSAILLFLLNYNHVGTTKGMDEKIDPNTFAIMKYVLLFFTVSEYFIIKYLQKRLTSTKSLKPITSAILGMCVAIAIYGRVLFHFSGNLNYIYVFSGISLWYFYLFFPRYSDWEKIWTKESATL